MPLEQTCNCCKGKFTEELINEADELYCSKCFADTFTQCDSCKEICETKDTEKCNGKDWCNTCLDNQTTVCEGCGHRFYRSDLHAVEDDSLYCSDCFNEKFAHCNSCREIIELEGAVFWNDEYWCDVCLDDETFICEDCGGRYGRHESYTGADDYLYCSECINSNSSEDIAVPEHKIPFIKTSSQTFKENKHRNFCGVEIECLNDDIEEKCLSYNDLVKYGFSQTSDGSLDGELGAEFVSNPFNGDLLLKKITEFCNELNNRNYYTNKSCGLHIHMGVANRIKFLQKIFIFYLKFEDFFFKMLPSSRKDNSYCQTLKSTCSHITPAIISKCRSSSDFQKLFYQVKSKNTIRALKKHKYNEKRYSWLNFHSLFYRGTLEIRNHSGTLDSHKIKNWFLIHLTILDFLKHLSFQTICELPETDQFFLSLFDKDLQLYISERWQKFNTNYLEVAC